MKLLLLSTTKTSLVLTSKQWRIIESIKRAKKRKSKLKFSKKLSINRVDSLIFFSCKKISSKPKITEKKVCFFRPWRSILALKDEGFSMKLIKSVSLLFRHQSKGIKLLRLGRRYFYKFNVLVLQTKQQFNIGRIVNLREIKEKSWPFKFREFWKLIKFGKISEKLWPDRQWLELLIQSISSKRNRLKVSLVRFVISFCFSLFRESSFLSRFLSEITN